MEQFISFSIGAVAVIFNKKLAKVAINSQNKTWSFKFGQKEENAARIAFVGFGLFLLLSVIRTIFE